MIAGLSAYDGNFLVDLSAIESRIAQTNEQITTGKRVNQPSDDPSAVASIIAYQGNIVQLHQVQTNLSTAQTEAQTADGALQSASTLMDQLVSAGASGATSTQTPAGRAKLGEQVQQIEQQLVGIANTTVSGRYIFGGDSPSTPPYTFNWSAAGGVVQNSTPSNTATIRDSDGNQLVPRLTGQQIFDTRNPDGTPATGNIFQAAYALGQALQANNQTGIQTALDQVRAGVDQLGLATTSYGDIQTWIQGATQTATNHLNDYTQALSSVRDADVTTDITQLSLNETALTAAIAAHGSLNGLKSLFSYLG